MLFQKLLVNAKSGPTEWHSGSGGVGETPQSLLHILAKRACAQAAEPLSD
jgi:hypothetical protein